MQRYDLPGDGGQYDLELLPLDDGGYVIYEDALAAVQAARAEGHRDAIASMDGQSVILASECEKQIAAARAQGQRDEREKWEPMVQALTDELLAKPPEMSMGAQYLAGVAEGQRDALAAIEALGHSPLYLTDIRKALAIKDGAE